MAKVLLGNVKGPPGEPCTEISDETIAAFAAAGIDITDGSSGGGGGDSGGDPGDDTGGDSTVNEGDVATAA